MHVNRYYCPVHGRTQVDGDDRCVRCGRPVHVEEKDVS